MSEVQCLKIRLKPGTTDQAIAFLKGLRHRRNEVRESLEAEGILSESLFLERTDRGDFLIFHTRAEDLQAAGAAFEASKLPLDLETKDFIQGTWQDVRPLELIVDLEGEVGGE